MAGQRLYDASRDYQRACKRGRKWESEAQMLATKLAIARRLQEAATDMLGIAEGRYPD